MADVNVWTENKYNSSGTRIITDEIVRYKIVQSIDKIISQNRSALAANGIHRAKVTIVRDFDDPTNVPYPLRRSDLEVELYIPTVTSLAQ